MRAVIPRLIRMGAAALLLLLAAVAHGQPYPTKTIRIIAPVQPGGGDLVARTIADRLSKVLGHSVIVENLIGGGGVIASQQTARAAPDGYTRMVGYVGTHGTNPPCGSCPLTQSGISHPSRWSAARPTCWSCRRRCPSTR
jgi:tripartite-type tricarboxylate transporter receptor subunit TctC